MFTVIETKELRWANKEKTQLFGKVITKEYGPAEILIHEDYDLEWGRIYWKEAMSGKHGKINKYVAPTLNEIRSGMTNLQRKDFRLKLKAVGVNTSTIQTFLEQIEDEDLREDFEIEWEDETEFNRMDPFVVALFEYAGITPEQADIIWEE